jgi:hypothetical protein
MHTTPLRIAFLLEGSTLNHRLLKGFAERQR